MKTIFWSESHESLLCGEPGVGDAVCEIEWAGDGRHATSIDILPLIISLSRRFSNFNCEFSDSRQRIFSIDFFRMPDLFIFALVTPVTRFFSSVILSFCRKEVEKVERSDFKLHGRRYTHNRRPVSPFNYIVSGFLRVFCRRFAFDGSMPQ